MDRKEMKLNPNLLISNTMNATDKYIREQVSSSLLALAIFAAMIILSLVCFCNF
jgi:hypothetical protein